MPLDALANPGRLVDDREGVVFLMNDGVRTISVLVSRRALEAIDHPEQRGGRIARFNEFRGQFEQIASDKYDSGLVEVDGTVCIRDRDLPGRGH